MDDADRAGDQGPSESVVHRVHDRYLTEVVEELGLCPFARKCRESARLQRPIFQVQDGRPTVAECAAALVAVYEAHPEVEVVLLTFVGPEGHALWAPERFEPFFRKVREEVERLRPHLFYMVGFHPVARGPAAPATLHAHSLAPLLRRTPDPVIQCVRTELLDRMRQDSARWSRLVASEPDAELRAMLSLCLPSSSQVSDDIAEVNFLRVGEGEGRRELEARIADIQADRARSYAAERAAPGAGGGDGDGDGSEAAAEREA